MVTNKTLNFNFDWGDPVMIKQNAPQCYKPGSQGCICGIRIIDSKEIAQQFDQIIGSELFLVEFNNGETLEIPKNFLIHFD